MESKQCSAWDGKEGVHVACSPKPSTSGGRQLSIWGTCMGSLPQVCPSVGRLTRTFGDIISLMFHCVFYVNEIICLVLWGVFKDFIYLERWEEREKERERNIGV